MPIADEMGNNLRSTLEMFMRELLRSKMNEFHRNGQQEHEARLVAKDLTTSTGQEYEVQYFRTHEQAERVLKGLQAMDPKKTMFGLSRLDRQDGHCLIVPKRADRIVRMISRDYGYVSIIMDQNGKEKQPSPFKTTVDNEGWAHITMGDLSDPNSSLTAQYMASVLNDADIPTRTLGNQILLPAEDYARAIEHLEKANEKLAKMGPVRAEEFLQEQYFDRTGHRFDPDAKVILPDSATHADSRIVDVMLENGDITKDEAVKILSEEKSSAKDIKEFFSEHREATVRALADNIEYITPSQLHMDPAIYAEARDHADTIANVRSELEARGIKTYDAKGRDFAVAEGDQEAVKAYMDEKGMAPSDVKVSVYEQKPEFDDPNKDIQPEKQAEKVRETVKTGPEQTPEIDAEEVAEKTIEEPVTTVDGVAAPGEDADAALSRETRKAELHEDIANVKTTADCVQARPDANNTDISTPYADGQDAPGTGDMDGDGVQDSAEDRDGDGTPDDLDADEEYLDDDPDYEPVSMKQRDCDELMAEKSDAAEFEAARAASRDVALETVER